MENMQLIDSLERQTSDEKKFRLKQDVRMRTEFDGLGDNLMAGYFGGGYYTQDSLTDILDWLKAYRILLF